MGEQAFEMEVLVVSDGFWRRVSSSGPGATLGAPCRCRSRGGSRSGVDASGCCGGEPIEMCSRPEHRGEVVLEDQGSVFGERGGHDKDTGLVEAGGSQGFGGRRPFLRISDSEPGGSGAGQTKGAEPSGVAVGVGFDYG